MPSISLCSEKMWVKISSPGEGRGEGVKIRAFFATEIAKIETGRAVRNLPGIILGTIGRHALGIMIARGNLAVELGSVRLAEIQEEILWLCEAAHVPVIWATQVLETLAKHGAKSRPEITNKRAGYNLEKSYPAPFLLRVLGNILSRMEAHQHKKTTRLRALHW